MTQTPTFILSPPPLSRRRNNMQSTQQQQPTPVQQPLPAVRTTRMGTTRPGYTYIGARRRSRSGSRTHRRPSLSTAAVAPPQPPAAGSTAKLQVMTSFLSLTDTPRASPLSSTAASPLPSPFIPSPSPLGTPAGAPVVARREAAGDWAVLLRGFKLSSDDEEADWSNAKTRASTHPSRSSTLDPIDPVLPPPVPAPARPTHTRNESSTSTIRGVPTSTPSHSRTGSNASTIRGGIVIPPMPSSAPPRPPARTEAWVRGDAVRSRPATNALGIEALRVRTTRGGSPEPAGDDRPRKSSESTRPTLTVSTTTKPLPPTPSRSSSSSSNSSSFLSPATPTTAQLAAFLSLSFSPAALRTPSSAGTSRSHFSIPPIPSCIARRRSRAQLALHHAAQARRPQLTALHRAKSSTAIHVAAAGQVGEGEKHGSGCFASDGRASTVSGKRRMSISKYMHAFY